MLKTFFFGAFAAALLAGFIGDVKANEYEAEIKKVFEARVKPWLSDPVIVAAIKQQNEAHTSFDEGKINKLDQAWRQEAKAGKGELIDKVMGTNLSKFLTEKKVEFQGLITEAFVMDNKGLNVGQSDVTSDYMQGDEAKWQKTFRVGPDAIFVDDVEFDDSTGQFQAQISASITDPASGQVIGAITLGMNIDDL